MDESPGSGYFSFQKMVSAKLIKVIYALGALAITVFGIIPIINALQISSAYGRVSSDFVVIQLLWGLGIIVFGNLLWRIFCEALILMFMVHENLKIIRERAEDIRFSDLATSMRQPLDLLVTEIRESASHKEFREFLKVLARQFETSAAHLSAIERGLREGIAHEDVRSALMTIANESKQGTARVANLENLVKQMLDRPLASSGLEEVVQPVVEESEKVKKPVFNQTLAIGGLIAVIVFIIGYIGIPIVSGSATFQDIPSFLSSVKDYWMRLFGAM